MQVMVRFYEVWRGTGCEPAEALRQAQQWVRDTPNEVKRLHFPDVPELAGQHVPPEGRPLWAGTREYASPAEWAGFTLTGV
jgi:CHAT domain-containing protein